MLNDELQAPFLDFLPNSWETSMVSMSNLTIGSNTLDVVNKSVFNKDNRRKEKIIDHGQAFIMMDMGKGKKKRSKDHNKFREKTKCYHCKKFDHLKRNCRNLKQEHK